MPKKDIEQFYGTATVSEKGQVVIPCEARERMHLQKGDKLLVFGMGCDMIAFTKLSNIEKFASNLSNQLETIRGVIKKSNK